EDIAQEVFVTVFRSIDQFRGESKFSTWLYRIATNHCKNRMKYLSRRPTSAAGLDAVAEHDMADQPRASSPQSHIDPPDALLEGRELERVMHQAISALDEEHRLLVLLRDVEELSYQEMVEITGLSEGTVKSRLHRARMQIKEQVGRYTKGNG